jgi:hypothetical protein
MTTETFATTISHIKVVVLTTSRGSNQAFNCVQNPLDIFGISYPGIFELQDSISLLVSISVSSSISGSVVVSILRFNYFTFGFS